MGSRFVPVLIALSDAEQTAIPHIHRDNKLFAFFCRHCPFAQNHRIKVDVVVNRGDGFFHIQLYALDDVVGNSTAVQFSKCLRNTHIMQIIVH